MAGHEQLACWMGRVVAFDQELATSGRIARRQVFDEHAEARAGTQCRWEWVCDDPKVQAALIATVQMVMAVVSVMFVVLLPAVVVFAIAVVITVLAVLVMVTAAAAAVARGAATAGFALVSVTWARRQEGDLGDVEIAVPGVADRQGLQRPVTEQDATEIGRTCDGKGAARGVAADGEHERASRVVAHDGDRRVRRTEVGRLEAQHELDIAAWLDDDREAEIGRASCREGVEK